MSRGHETKLWIWAANQAVGSGRPIQTVVAVEFSLYVPKAEVLERVLDTDNDALFTPIAYFSSGLRAAMWILSLNVAVLKDVKASWWAVSAGWRVAILNPMTEALDGLCRLRLQSSFSLSALCRHPR